MSSEELKTLKEDVVEVKQGMNDIRNTLTDLSVLVAGNYVRRDEFEDERKENNKAHDSIKRDLIGWILGVGTLITAILAIVLK